MSAPFLDPRATVAVSAIHKKNVMEHQEGRSSFIVDIVAEGGGRSLCLQPRQVHPLPGVELMSTEVYLSSIPLARVLRSIVRAASSQRGATGEQRHSRATTANA